MSAQTTVMTSKDPEGFIRLGDYIWFVKADEPERHIDKSHPTIILIFGWMDGKPAHIAKFSAGYRKLYPQTPQVVCGAPGKILFLPQATLRRKMQPMLDQLISLKVLGEGAEPHRILTHTLSNGGLSRLNHLAQLLVLPSNSKNIPVPNQPSAMIIDSAPGGDDFSSAVVTFRATMPSRFVGYPFLLFLFSIYAIRWLIGSPWRVFESLRLAMLNPRWLPWITPTTSASAASPTPFLFIYSKADQSVLFEQVQAFIARAEVAGIPVYTEVFETSPHVSHMRSDPSRYWAAVMKHWRRAMNLD